MGNSEHAIRAIHRSIFCIDRTFIYLTLPQPRSREELYDDMLLNLDLLREYVEYQCHASPDSDEWLYELYEHFTPAFKFVKESIRETERGKCPETTEEDQ